MVDITYNGTVFDTVASPFSEERAIELAKKKVDQDGLDWLGVDFLL